MPNPDGLSYSFWIWFSVQTSAVNILIFAVGLFVIFIFLFDRQLLISRESFRIILALSILVSVFGVIGHLTIANSCPTCGALFAPLVSLFLFRLCRRIFFKYYNREPKDTFLDWGHGLAADRLFNIVYFTLAMWLAVLTTFGLSELARMGW